MQVHCFEKKHSAFFFTKWTTEQRFTRCSSLRFPYHHISHFHPPNSVSHRCCTVQCLCNIRTWRAPCAKLPADTRWGNAYLKGTALEAEDRPRARMRTDYLLNPTDRWTVVIILILDFFHFKVVVSNRDACCNHRGAPPLLEELLFAAVKHRQGSPHASYGSGCHIDHQSC